jgi:hypothetical protein
MSPVGQFIAALNAGWLHIRCCDELAFGIVTGFSIQVDQINIDCSLVDLSIWFLAWKSWHKFFNLRLERQMNSINKTLSIAVALSIGTFFLSQAASAAPLDQCGILKGKHYLIEIEYNATTGDYISFGVVDFFASPDKDGFAGTENLVWTYMHGGGLSGGLDKFRDASRVVGPNENDPLPGIRSGTAFCGVTTIGSAYYSFLTDPGKETAVQEGKQVPKMYFGNSLFKDKQARVYLLPTPWRPQ